MKLVVLTLIIGIFCNLHFGLAQNLVSHEDAERDFRPSYLSLATANQLTLQQFTKRIRHPWPVSVKSIGHTTASYQRYGSINEAYFHHGLDVRADSGSKVIASAGGRVVNIENYVPGNDAYWEVAILDELGFLWQYHHIERDSIPKSLFSALKNKTPIPAGTEIGEVYYWGVVTFGERFHHIHLNILGKNGEYLNPFDFLEPLSDKSAPEIVGFYLIQDGEKVSGPITSGRDYSIAAEIHDWILSDVFIVPPNEIVISIDGKGPGTVWKFDSLPGGPDNGAFVNQFYVPSLACGDYDCRKPIIDLGFKKVPSQVFPKNSGLHSLTLKVTDYSGNATVRTFDWTVE